MKRNLFFTVVAILMSGYLFSQEKKISEHGSQVQMEVLGPGGMISFHFDSRFRKTNDGPGYNVGLGFAPYGLLEESCNRGGVITIPAGLNYLFGKKHFLEVGAGGVLNFGGGTKVYCMYIEDSFFETGELFYSYVLLGYRFQPMSKRMTIRAFISPLFQKDLPVKFWGGAGIGLKLRSSK